MSVIEASEMTVRRNSRNALNHIDLIVPEGITALLGPNGSGKSTLLQTVSAALSPQAGAIRVHGLDPSLPAERRKVRESLGYLPQDFGFWPHFTVAEQLVYLGWIKGVPKRRRLEEARRTARRVGLEDRLDERMKALSGGMVRRIGVAQALLGTPRLILLDEPMAGLDPEQRAAMSELVASVAAEGRSVLLSTHLLSDLAGFCDHVVVLREGRVGYCGTTAGFLGLAIAEDGSAGSPEQAYTAVMAAAADPAVKAAGREDVRAL